MWNVCVCCRFDDFDDAIDEAIEEDIGELCGGEWTMWKNKYGIKNITWSNFWFIF